ncbi:MAG TPA: hypothetical protein VFB14_14045 [Bryobacteraceae bacterium]|jgi:hypothetical protein|nr:hypothetical protein [Bryobacteraceae bacterium]
MIWTEPAVAMATRGELADPASAERIAHAIAEHLAREMARIAGRGRVDEILTFRFAVLLDDDF